MIDETRPEMTALRCSHCASTQMAGWILLVTPGELCLMAGSTHVPLEDRNGNVARRRISLDSTCLRVDTLSSILSLKGEDATAHCLAFDKGVATCTNEQRHA